MAGKRQMMMSFKMFKVGQWIPARKAMDLAAFRFLPAVARALDQEMKLFKKKIKSNMRKKGAEAKRPFEALSSQTIATRRFRGVKGRRPLIAKKSLINSIAIKKTGPFERFVGIPHEARGPKGESLAVVGNFHEQGKPTHRIQAKKRGANGRFAMFNFLFMLFKQSGTAGKGSGQANAKTGVIVVSVPARPFLGPVFDAHFGDEAKTKARMLARVQAGMGFPLDFGAKARLAAILKD